MSTTFYQNFGQCCKMWSKEGYKNETVGFD
nr:MAG TPA: hypothetical protein [Caudoviricetes sp.]DAX46558.1 MAG TPA: hypothetical protein [Caudoviricetes sp.]